MKLIIGLGNPGKKYQKTRHNVGFMVLDELVGKENWSENKNAKAQYSKTDLDGQRVELLKPMTYMNESGYAAGYASKKHGLKPKDILVVYDDIDLPLGKIRIGQFESAGGHKGVQSIIDHLRTNDFIRFRVGIKNDKADKQPAEKFVLKKFSRSEKELLNKTVKSTAKAIKMSLTKSLDQAMNEFN